MPSFLRKDQNENCQPPQRHTDKTNCFLQCMDRNELPRIYVDKTVLRHANIIMEGMAWIFEAQLCRRRPGFGAAALEGSK